LKPEALTRTKVTVRFRFKFKFKFRVTVRRGSLVSSLSYPIYLTEPRSEGNRDGGKFVSWLRRMPMEDERSFLIARSSAAVLRILTGILTKTLWPTNATVSQDHEERSEMGAKPEQFQAKIARPSFATQILQKFISFKCTKMRKCLKIKYMTVHIYGPGMADSVKVLLVLVLQTRLRISAQFMRLPTGSRKAPKAIRLNVEKLRISVPVRRSAIFNC